MISVVVISVLSVFAKEPNGHYMGYAMNPVYLRMDAVFTKKASNTTELYLRFGIVCGAARKKFEKFFNVGPSLPPGAYAILAPIPPAYEQLLSFYNKECGRTPAVDPDFFKFFYEQRANRVYVKVQGSGKDKDKFYLNKYEA